MEVPWFPIVSIYSTGVENASTKAALAPSMSFRGTINHLSINEFITKELDILPVELSSSHLNDWWWVSLCRYVNLSLWNCHCSWVTPNICALSDTQTHTHARGQSDGDRKRWRQRLLLIRSLQSIQKHSLNSTHLTMKMMRFRSGQAARGDIVWFAVVLFNCICTHPISPQTQTRTHTHTHTHARMNRGLFTIVKIVRETRRDICLPQHWKFENK